MKRILHYICSEALRLKREEQGVIMAISLAVWMFLFVLICGVYTLGTTIQEREALQHASDAAAISAATIQADALSRMATINKAMSYTYMSMSRKQMDCILMEWLWLIDKRFREDEQACANWASVLFITRTVPVDLVTLIGCIWGILGANVGIFGIPPVDEVESCSLFPNGTPKNGRSYFCGVVQRKLEEIPPPRLQLGDLLGGRRRAEWLDWVRAGRPQRYKEVSTETGGTVLLNGRVTELSRFPITSIKDSIKTLKQGIASDKLLMRSLNSMYAQIHRSACESMERTVPMVLRQNLSAVFNQTELDKVYYSAKLPNGAWDPYQTSLIVQTGGDGTQGTSSNDQYAGNNGYFSTLSNIENDERLFLNMMGSVNCNINPVQGESAYTLNHLSSLTKYFMPPPASGNGGIFAFLQGNEHSTSGVDQWFVRGRPFYGNTPTYVRRDGGEGLQRVFWDTNANPQNEEFRGGGISLQGKGPTRGNHMVNLSNVAITHHGLVEDVLGELLSPLMRLLDIQPSVFNSGGDIRSCSQSEDSMALVADYEWWSAKWFCIAERETEETFLGVVIRYYYVCNGNHSFGFPKYYCGNSGKRNWRWLPPWRMGIPDQLEFMRNCDDIAMFDTIKITDAPPTGSPSFKGLPLKNCHGYEVEDGENYIFDVANGITKEFQVNSNIGNGTPRTKYRQCVIGARGGKPYIGGFSRIYADDREICKTRSPGEDDVKFDANGKLVDVDIYTGACAQPWILNERFFGTDGTITVAVAKRRANPFARLVGRIWDVEKTSPTSIGNPAGEPDKETYMWTMSSARAAFRQSEGAPLETAYRYLNPEAGNDCLSDSVKPGESGCVCGETAQRRLAKQWNLCTTYWEPVLLPVALADQYRAVDGRLLEEPWVGDPTKATSALWKLFFWDFKLSSADVAEDDHGGWQSLGQEEPKKIKDFLLITPPSNVKMERTENQKQELSILKLYEDRLL